MYFFRVAPFDVLRRAGELMLVAELEEMPEKTGPGSIDEPAARLGVEELPALDAEGGMSCVVEVEVPAEA